VVGPGRRRSPGGEAGDRSQCRTVPYDGFPSIVAHPAPTLTPVSGAPPVAAGQDGWMDSAARLVALEGSFNFRDLGGYATADGRTVRWGRLFRSDALHELTPGDVATCGRSPTHRRRPADDRELARSGRGPLRARGRGLPPPGGGQGGRPGSTARPTVAADGEAVAPRHRPATTWPSGTSGTSTWAAMPSPGRSPSSAPASAIPWSSTVPRARTAPGVLAALVLELLGVDGCHRHRLRDHRRTDRAESSSAGAPSRASPSGWPRCPRRGSAWRGRPWRGSWTDSGHLWRRPGVGPRAGVSAADLDRMADLLLEPSV